MAPKIGWMPERRCPAGFCGGAEFQSRPEPGFYSECRRSTQGCASLAGPRQRTFLIAANLAIFFVWTFPTNQATNNWTVVPNNWNELRVQWEYSHVANAMVAFSALL
jgi:hypothetical protein